MERELTFSSGTRRIPVSIPIQSDQLDEPNETFRALLSQEPATSTVTLMPATATVTITDDDGKMDNNNQEYISRKSVQLP